MQLNAAPPPPQQRSKAPPEEESRTQTTSSLTASAAAEQSRVGVVCRSESIGALADRFCAVALLLSQVGARLCKQAAPPPCAVWASAPSSCLLIRNRHNLLRRQLDRQDTLQVAREKEHLRRQSVCRSDAPLGNLPPTERIFNLAKFLSVAANADEAAKVFVGT